jgi:hypothetical protein
LAGQRAQLFEDFNQVAIGDQLVLDPFGINHLCFSDQPVVNLEHGKGIAILGSRLRWYWR